MNQFLVLNGQQFDLVWGVCYAIDNAHVVFDLTHVSICVQKTPPCWEHKNASPSESLAILSPKPVTQDPDQ